MKNNNIFFALVLFIGFSSPIHLNAETYPNIVTNFLTKTYATLKKYMPNMIQELKPINVLTVAGAGAFITYLYYLHKQRRGDLTPAEKTALFEDYRGQKQSDQQKLEKLRQKYKAQQFIPINLQDPTRE